MKKITLCITCYKNDIKFLDRCLQSVVNQTVKPEQVLVIANSIEDDSPFLNKDEFDFFSIKDHKLPGWGRNMGLKLAKNEIVSFCDVDDIIHPRKIELIKNVFTDEVDALIHNFFWISGEFNNVINYDIEEITEIDKKCTNIKTPSRRKASQGHMTCKKSLSKYFSYDETRLRGEDGAFCQKIALSNDHKIFYSPEKLIIYTQD